MTIGYKPLVASLIVSELEVYRVDKILAMKSMSKFAKVYILKKSRSGIGEATDGRAQREGCRTCFFEENLGFPVKILISLLSKITEPDGVI